MRGEDLFPFVENTMRLETSPHAWGRPCRFIEDTRCKESCLDSSFYIENISAKVLTFSQIYGVVFPRCSKNTLWRTTPPDSMAFFVPFCQSRHFFWL